MTELSVPVGDDVAIRVTWPIARRRARIRNNSILNAWRVFIVDRDYLSHTKDMFLNEPLFYNSLFKRIRREHSFIDHFIQNGVHCVSDLMIDNTR